MRFRRSIFCSCLCLNTSYLASSQATTSQIPTSFQQQVQTAVSAGKPFSVVNLTATAEWIAGSDHESGSAQLQAKVDGSANVQLMLGKASRTDIQTTADASRTCTWVDSVGKTHAFLGLNCFVAIPWFAPGLYAQTSTSLPSLLGVTDGGAVSKDGSAFHQMSYVLKLAGSDATSTNRLVNQSTVNVFYDPKTFLPVSLEYFIHPDNNDSQNIPVRVVFSNYQSVSGVMLPFQIDRYINRTLQLKLDVSNATIE
jgi:hypothetical protein